MPIMMIVNTAIIAIMLRCVALFCFVSYSIVIVTLIVIVTVTVIVIVIEL